MPRSTVNHRVELTLDQLNAVRHATEVRRDQLVSVCGLSQTTDAERDVMSLEIIALSDALLRF